jgi:hypothetical protein
MTYQCLLEEAKSEGVKVIDDCNIGGLKGLYIDNIISLSKNISCQKEKKCILAEELGHHHTTYGNILNQNKIDNIQQEKKARAWAYERLVNFDDLIAAYKEGINNQYELSLFLEVTENFLINAIKYYRRKYGIYYKYKNVILYFEPLGILKKEEFK